MARKKEPVGKVKHRSDLAFCGCKTCNHGMHKGDGGWQVQYARRQFRRAIKAALKQGNEPPKRWPVGYTD